MALYRDLNMDLTPEQIAIKEETHKFAKEELRPASLELDKINDPKEMIESDLLHSTLRKGYELGYHTIFIPDNYGGLATDPLETHIVLEELGWGSVDFAVAFGVACFPAFMSAMVPTEELIEDIIEPFCACTDASIIGCWGMTEPEHGTDTVSPFTDQFRNPAITGQCTARLDITLSTANAGMGAMFTGLARAAYEEALAYAKQRIQGGKHLLEHQLIKHKLFSMFTKIEASRQLSRAAMIYNYNNTPPRIEYSIAAKTFATQTAFEVTSDAIQIFGGNGLSREYPIEKFFRDARASMIEDGANDTLMITGAYHL